ncbi:MAG: VOC family protein [Bryobacteraceae bacterium]
MTIHGVAESSLYVENVARTRDFFVRVFGFEVLDVEATGRFAAFAVAPGSVLLVFRKGSTTSPVTFAGGTIPAHDGHGNLHFAFSIDADAYEDWKQRLSDNEVAIESEVVWPKGGRSIYFRDPDGHLGELITPGVWKNY